MERIKLAYYLIACDRNMRLVSGVTIENQTSHGVDNSAVLQHEFGFRDR